MPIANADATNADQIAYWNGSGGRSWVGREAMQESSLEPVTTKLLACAAAKPGERAIDVGCGTGPTTIALVRQVAPGGQVLGIDVSEPMLERARTRLPADAPATLIQADATTYAFPAGAFDLAVSRFGIMFFAEPAKSFANLRRALRSGGRLAFVCWRRLEDNPWNAVPMRAVLQHIPAPPAAAPEAPGPFSFADEGRVRRVLGAAGFEHIALEPFDFAFDLGRGRPREEAARLIVSVGPANRLLAGQPPEIVSAVAATLGAALAPYERDGRIPLPAAAWIVTAANP